LIISCPPNATILFDKSDFNSKVLPSIHVGPKKEGEFIRASDEALPLLILLPFDFTANRPPTNSLRGSPIADRLEPMGNMLKTGMLTSVGSDFQSDVSYLTASFDISVQKSARLRNQSGSRFHHQLLQPPSNL